LQFLPVSPAFVAANDGKTLDGSNFAEIGTPAARALAAALAGRRIAIEIQ